MTKPNRRLALLSVYFKQDVVKLAYHLVEHDFELVSTGGTAKALRDGGLTVIDVSEMTGFPEMMDGRLKTLHPKIFGGILGRTDLVSDLEHMAEHDIHPFELVIVNLYPFEETASKPGVLPADVIEQIDVGGPSMIRAGMKNHAYVGVVTHPDQYKCVIDELDSGGVLSHKLRVKLASETACVLMRDAVAVNNWLCERVRQA